jgi:predicted RNA-binding Zn-ribbon protein involved in translation (DUF1610 family)
MTVTTTLEVERPTGTSEIYSDPEARKILQSMLKSPRTIITPEILPTDEVRYPVLEAIVPANPEVVLSRLTKAGVIIGDLIDKAPQCPECGSRQVSTRYLCPKCFSFDVVRSYLFEHLKCGKVANDSDFRKGEQLICPKCQIALHNFGVEFRAVGAWYRCNSCTESFNIPVHSHFCRPNRHQFNLEKVRLSPIFQYRINPERLAEIRREVSFYAESLAILESHGFSFRAPHELVGKSGESRSFDVVVTISGHWRGNKVIPVDIMRSESAVPADVVRGFVEKVKDVRPAEAYLVAVPGLTDEAKALAQRIKVNFIEATSVKEGTELLVSRGSFKEHKD